MNPEANRCLLCKVPLCSKNGCPVHTPVPQAMSLYRQGQIMAAAQLVFDNNPFSAITSRVCDWKKFCYGHCVLNAKKAPVAWYAIEQEISAACLPQLHVIAEPSSGRSVAIIGGGPAGITAAFQLRKAGVAVTLFEKKKCLGGMLRHGIPEFRLSPQYMEEIERILRETDVQIKTETEVREIASLQKKYDALLLTIGAEKPRALHIPGENMSHVHNALHYLEDPDRIALGKETIVIGGGNVAMDAARTALRHGVRTTIYYRKTFANMPANPLEVQEAQSEGVLFQVFKAPVEVREHSVIFCDCQNVVDADGRVKTKILEGTEQEVACDSLLIAAGETPDDFLFQGQRPAMDEAGQVEADIFTAGDYRLGARTVVEAVQSAKQAAQAMLARLEN